MQRFELAAPAAVHYDTETRNDDSYDVCVITRSEEQFWKDGNAVRGYACNGQVSRAADSAALAAGEYALALRCRNVLENCVVAVTLSVG